MAPSEHYDAIIIGSGQSGGPLSTALVAAGKRTALIERAHIGGTCINEGCTPTKTMVASARVAYFARRAADYGVHTGPVSVNLGEVRTRKQAIVDTFRDGSTQAIENGGVEIVRGEGRFLDRQTIRVSGAEGKTRELQASLIVINTGCRSAALSINGMDTIPALDPPSVMELDELPSHLVILGGGYVGLEFGQMFHRFGSEVTIVEMGPRLAAREDPQICAALSDILAEDGIQILLNAKAQRVGGVPGAIEIEVALADGTRTLRASHLLVAVGRTPNTDALKLEAAGVETDSKGFIKVNDRLETSAPEIYSMGDVNEGQPQFTHISYDDFRILRDNLLHGGSRTTRDRLVPYTVFTDPQLGRVGMTEEQARASGKNFKVASMHMSSVARALEVDEPRGLVRAVVDADSGHILGASVLGMEGGEVMAMFEIAMMGKLPYTELKEGIFAHPTLAELMNNLFSGM
jgi:pyruvate/2-oxoglutarate dehydrogenase complex dihydrolipoamide dehydrogenase (E3) component